MGYTFPQHYPKGCPPEPHDDMCGTYFRVVRNTNKSDLSNFKSQYELGEMSHLESTEACERRALSLFSSYNEAVALAKQVPTIGKYVACLILKGGHGVVHKVNSGWGKTHHDWWVPSNTDPVIYCEGDIKEAKL